ncbi:hypothetical protein [Chitinophaga rhizosphaerae]|uniref:hypothetical protein n=1 Tax=Chitinophaga rhizosphaerae TaxID=1864947 RepID=UPI000F805E81|nr:hypothetical protein [Chitinophaga rhizosphaerae]
MADLRTIEQLIEALKAEILLLSGQKSNLIVKSAQTALASGKLLAWAQELSIDLDRGIMVKNLDRQTNPRIVELVQAIAASRKSTQNI